MQIAATKPAVLSCPPCRGVGNDEGTRCTYCGGSGDLYRGTPEYELADRGWAAADRCELEAEIARAEELATQRRAAVRTLEREQDAALAELRKRLADVEREYEERIDAAEEDLAEAEHERCEAHDDLTAYNVVFPPAPAKASAKVPSLFEVLTGRAS